MICLQYILLFNQNLKCYADHKIEDLWLIFIKTSTYKTEIEKKILFYKKK